MVERQSKLKRPELLRYASRVMKLDKEGESFMQKLNRLFMEAGAPPFFPYTLLLGILHHLAEVLLSDCLPGQSGVTAL